MNRIDEERYWRVSQPRRSLLRIIMAYAALLTFGVVVVWLLERL